MSFFVSLGIVIVTMLIMACLQLQPGVFSLLNHYANGKYSKKHASEITSFFILGSEATSAFLFVCCYFIANLLFLYQFNPETGLFAWVVVGVLMAMALLSLSCYFRKGPGTQLFISRKCAKNLEQHAKSIKTRSDAFTLGALSSIYELPFTLPLYIIVSLEIIEMSVIFFPSHLLTLFFIMTPTIPLFIMRLKFKLGYNLADIERSRIKDKTFTRIILCLSYITIAILFIYFRIIA